MESAISLTRCALQLAMGVLGTLFGGVFLLSGGSKKVAQQGPPINASSKGEEDFIQYVWTRDTLVVRRDTTRRQWRRDKRLTQCEGNSSRKLRAATTRREKESTEPGHDLVFGRNEEDVSVVELDVMRRCAALDARMPAVEPSSPVNIP